MPVPTDTTAYGTLRVAAPADSDEASRLSRANDTGRTYRLAARVYVEDSTAPPEALVRFHLVSLLQHFWPGPLVLCDQSGFADLTPVQGWLFVCQPEPGRLQPRLFPGLVIAARAGPGPLPGDRPLPAELRPRHCDIWRSGLARALVDNVSVPPGRAPQGGPFRRAGTVIVQERIAEIRRTGGRRALDRLTTQLDPIADQLRPTSVARVRQLVAEARA